jgi:hypothetical protein
MMNMPICKACGAKTKYIQTAALKQMPVNPKPLYCVEDPDSKMLVITASGVVIKARLQTPQDRTIVIAYIPHWQTCKDPASMRKRDNPDKVPAPAPAPVAPPATQLSFI